MMKDNYSKYAFLRDLFFGADTPLEARPIENQDYKKAWREIENIQNNLEKDHNSEVVKLLYHFGTIEDKRAFSSFVQGFEIGKMLYYR